MRSNVIRATEVEEEGEVAVVGLVVCKDEIGADGSRVVSSSVVAPWVVLSRLRGFCLWSRRYHAIIACGGEVSEEVYLVHLAAAAAWQQPRARVR